MAVSLVMLAMVKVCLFEGYLGLVSFIIILSLISLMEKVSDLLSVL